VGIGAAAHEQVGRAVDADGLTLEVSAWRTAVEALVLEDRSPGAIWPAGAMDEGQTRGHGLRSDDRLRISTRRIMAGC